MPGEIQTLSHLWFMYRTTNELEQMKVRLRGPWFLLESPSARREQKLMIANLLTYARRSATILSVSVCLVVAATLSPASAQELKGFNDPLGLKLSGGPAAPEVKVSTSLEPQSAQPGDTVTLSIAVELSPGSYTYSMSPAFGGGTKVKFEAEEGVQALGAFTPDHPPKVEYSKEFEQDLEKYSKAVTWSRKYKVQDVPTARIKGVLNYQVCDAQSCRNLRAPFDVTVQLASADPSPVPKRQPEVAAANDDRFQLQARLRHKNAQPFVRLTPIDAQPGDLVVLEFQVKLEDGWHIFSTTQPEGNAASATEFSLDSHVGLEAVDADFEASRPFEVKHLEVKSDNETERFTQEIYEHDVTWSRKFRLLPGTQLSEVKVKGKVLFQVCKDGVGCIPNSVKFDLPRAVDESVAGPTRGSTDPVPPGETPDIVPPPTPMAANNPGPVGSAPGSKVTDLSDAECVSSTGEGDIRDRGVLYVLGAAFVFGWLALLTPCVFPMVPITVSFFLKQAEKKHNSPLSMALVYCGSIIGTFTVLGLIVSALFGATYINSLANGILINLFLGIVLLFFALNLLGLFDIQIPSWLLTFTASKESTSSYLGVFFMALTFTLTSFTCTFAFLGLILVWAANGEFWWPLGGLVAFSTAFAMPFFLLAMFPSYLHKLPKSGGWMNRVKVVMGLIEMAFMFKFLSVADIAWNSTPTIFDYHLVMCAWLAIAIVAGLYLLGKIQLPHDTKEEHVGVIPMVCALFFFGLAGYLGVGIFAHEPPGGFFGRQIVAFAPPRFEGGVDEDGPFLIGKHDNQKYLLEFERAKEKARREQVPLFIDFTGVNCINCREMEALMADSAIQSNLGKFIRVQLYTDKMPKEAVGDTRRGEELLEHNRQLQEEWYKDTVLPGYAVVSPDGTVILSKIKGKVAAADFTTFLQCGLNKWERTRHAEVASTKP